MKKIYFLLFFNLILHLCSFSQSNIGKKIFNKINAIDDIFKGYKQEMGTAITGLEKEKKGYYIITNGYNKKVLLTKSIMQGNRVKYDVILAILDFDNLNKNEEIILQECRLNKKNDNLIIAIVEKINNQKYYYKAIKAFRLNPNNNTFNPISTIGIDCLNIEYYTQYNIIN